MPPSAAPDSPGSGLTGGRSHVQLGGTANVRSPHPADGSGHAAGQTAELADSRSRGRHRGADSVGCGRSRGGIPAAASAPMPASPIPKKLEMAPSKKLPGM